MDWFLCHERDKTSYTGSLQDTIVKEDLNALIFYDDQKPKNKTRYFNLPYLMGKQPNNLNQELGILTKIL